MPHSTVPCPHCGVDIDADATVCDHCGSSDSDGWREPDADSYEDEFDYDEFVRDQLSEANFSTSTPSLWRWTAFLLLALIGGFVLLSLWNAQ